MLLRTYFQSCTQVTVLVLIHYDILIDALYIAPFYSKLFTLPTWKMAIHKPEPHHTWEFDVVPCIFPDASLDLHIMLHETLVFLFGTLSQSYLLQFDFSQQRRKMFISLSFNWLTHWGRVTHICVGNIAIIGSDNGLSPGRRQAIIWTKAGILLIGPLGTNFSEILIEIQTFSFKKMHLKMSSAKWCPFWFGLNMLRHAINHDKLQITQRTCT